MWVQELEEVQALELEEGWQEPEEVQAQSETGWPS